MKQSNKLKNILFHVRYPYTAAVIAVMWISMAIIIVIQDQSEYELLIVATSICTILIAFLGFKNFN